MNDTTLKTRFGPTALVTGASEGIGRALAEALAAEGLDLILVARRAAVLEGLATDLAAQHGVAVRVHTMDLGQPGAVAALLSATQADEIGLLIAAAGFGSIGPFLERDPEAEAAMIDLNCRAVVGLAHGLGARMAVRGRGGMMLFGSLVGFQGAPNAATYAATKGFVQSFGEALAVELRGRGVHVLTLAPGPVMSGFAGRAGMQLGPADRPEVVARDALAALGRRAHSRPGLVGKALGWSLATAPRALRVRIMGQIMHGLIRKNDTPAKAGAAR